MNFRYLLGRTFKTSSTKNLSLQCCTWQPTLPAGRSLWPKNYISSQYNRPVVQWVWAQEHCISWLCSPGCSWHSCHHCWLSWIFPADVQLQHFLRVWHSPVWCSKVCGKWEVSYTDLSWSFNRVITEVILRLPFSCEFKLQNYFASI